MSKYDTDGFESLSFSICCVIPFRGSFDLDVAYWNEYLGEDSEITLDAVEVYRNLKAYFEGTKYE
jgi:hypothetical protein